MFSVGLKHVVGTCTVIALLTGCGDASPASSQNTQTHVQAGDNAVINTAADLVATSKDSLTELQNDVSANNTQDVQDMANKGLVLQLPVQTKVYVKDLSFSGIAHIRIDDGVYQGTEGYIPFEELTPSK